MTNKEAIEHLRELKTLRIEFLNALQEQALDMAIKALDIYKTFCPVEFPTDDDPYPVCSYTRPTGEEWLDNFINRYNKSKDFKITDIRDREKLLDDLRPKGEWIDCGEYYRCPFCSNWVLTVDGKPNYCDECGAKMKGGAE